MQIINAIFKLLCAIFKTLLELLNLLLFKIENKKAQTKAFNSACKKAKGRYDPDWHKNYRACLKVNRQKANDRKELRSTFIGSC